MGHTVNNEPAKQAVKILRCKAIFQALFEPKLGFYQASLEAAQKLEGYPHWQTDRLHITLWNQAAKCTLAIKHNSATYEQDSDDLKQEKKGVQDILSSIAPALGVKAFTRLGYRSRCLVPVQMNYQSLVSVCALKLYSQDERLRQILPPIVDTGFRLDADDPPYHYVIQIAPVKDAEVFQSVGFNREHHMPEGITPDELFTFLQQYPQIPIPQGLLTFVQQYPKIAIYFDVDFIQAGGNIPHTQAESFFQTAHEKTSRLISNLAEYVLN